MVLVKPVENGVDSENIETCIAVAGIQSAPDESKLIRQSFGGVLAFAFADKVFDAKGKL